MNTRPACTGVSKISKNPSVTPWPIDANVVPSSRKIAASTRALVGEIRALPAPAGVSVLITGPPAEVADQLHSLAAGLPWMLLTMALVTLVILFLAFGSVVLPVKAVVVNVLSVAAARLVSVAFVIPSMPPPVE